MIAAIQKNMTWRAVPIAAAAGGTVFLLTNVLLNPIILDVDALFIVRYFGSLLLGESVLTDSNALVLIVGVLVNYAIALIFGLLIAVVIHRWGLLIGILGGAILGLCVYAINIYTMTVFFPWFFAMNSEVLVISHVLFGMVVGGVYEMLDHYDVEVGL